MLTKLPTDIIKEAALAEEFNTTDMIADELKTKYNTCLENVAVIGKDVIKYRASMIPVFQYESSYYVELDNVVKYMESNEINDVQEAMENIAYSNELSASELSLVIESKDYMESVLESAIEQSKAGDKTLLENCELSIKLINLLEAQGINVVLKEEFINEASYMAMSDVKLKKNIDKISNKLDKAKNELEKINDMSSSEGSSYMATKTVSKVIVFWFAGIIGLHIRQLYVKSQGKGDRFIYDIYTYKSFLREVVSAYEKDLKEMNAELKSRK